MALRTYLVECRKEKEWSQRVVVEELSFRFGISITPSYYGMIEQGVRVPKLDLAFAISKLFERASEDLFFDLIPNKTLCNGNIVHNTA